MRNESSIVRELENSRKASRLTQAQLAQRSGVNRMTVGRIEAGLDPRLSTVQELARAMGMDIMLVPKELRAEIEGFVRSGGRLISQPPGTSAPKSVVDLIELAKPTPRGTRSAA